MIKRISIVCVMAVAAFCFAGTAVAADDNGQTDVQKLMTAYSHDAQQLKRIHEQAVHNNPDLVKQQDQFKQLVRGEIKKQGYDLDAGQKRIQAMTQKLQSKDLNDDQRQQVIKKFQNEREELIKARNAALAEPAVKKAGKKLEDATISAMYEQDNRTKALISDMKSKRKQIEKAALSQQQSSQKEQKSKTDSQ